MTDMDKVAGLQELEWIQRTIHGDHEAYRCLVLSYEPRLLAYLFRLLGNREDAHDVAQETFVAAFYALPRWKPLQLSDVSDDDQSEGKLVSTEQGKGVMYPLAPWLFRIATNRGLTLLKRQTVHSSLSQFRKGERLENEWSATLEDLQEIGMTLEDQFVARDLLNEALGHLSQEDATCLVLRFVLNEQYSEIAVHLGLTKEAVRKRITRGLIALRSAYKALDMEELF